MKKFNPYVARPTMVFALVSTATATMQQSTTIRTRRKLDVYLFIDG